MSGVDGRPQTNSNGASFLRRNNESPRQYDNKNVAMIVPRGCKIRDEFICPITRELITDPVIAADGHTYDRAAIEQWIHGTVSDGDDGRVENGKNRQKPSPKTGELLEHSILIPNHNLKRLLKDMIREGGESLYYHDKTSSSPDRNIISQSTESPLGDGQTNEPGANIPSTGKINQATTPPKSSSNIVNGQLELPNDGPRIALVHAKVIHCRCLGPPESDWSNRSFHLTESSTKTLLGGRRKPNEHTAQNFVQFTDATVSRRHFEIRFYNGSFQLRDLGSAGGTFVRIPPRCRVPLVEGTMIMLGKHQLVALGYSSNSIEENGPVEDGNENNSHETSLGNGRSTLTRDKVQESDSNENVVGFNLIEGFTPPFSNSDDDNHNEDASNNTDDSGFESNVVSHSSVNASDDKEECDSSRLPKMVGSMPLIRAENCGEDIGTAPTRHESKTSLSPSNSTNTESSPILFLRCFAPEGTPIQNRKYPISRIGATLGRKQSNTISFSHPIIKVGGDENDTALGPHQHSFVGIDSSISGEHATVTYNKETEVLELYDGVNKRGSTNGTWIRLSPMHEESEWVTLDDKSEILIGTVRFQVSVDDVVIERDIYD